MSNTSNQVTFILYLKGSCVLLSFMPKTIFYTVRFRLRLQYQNDGMAFCYDSPEDASAVVVRRLFNKTINREKGLSPRSSSAPADSVDLSFLILPVEPRFA